MTHEHKLIDDLLLACQGARDFMAGRATWHRELDIYSHPAFIALVRAIDETNDWIQDAERSAEDDRIYDEAAEEGMA